MYILKYNLTNTKYNSTNSRVGEYKCIFEILNIPSKFEVRHTCLCL